MFSKIVQRWCAFVKDWKEYKKLRRFAGKAWNKLFELRVEITAHHDAGKACIRKKALPVFRGFDDSYVFNPEIVIVEDHCPNFKSEVDGVTVQPCANTGCPYHAAHCKYMEAAAEYEQAMRKRREFWNSNNTAQK